MTDDIVTRLRENGTYQMVAAEFVGGTNDGLLALLPVEQHRWRLPKQVTLPFFVDENPEPWSYADGTEEYAQGSARVVHTFGIRAYQEIKSSKMFEQAFLNSCLANQQITRYFLVGMDYKPDGVMVRNFEINELRQMWKAKQND